MTPFSPQFRTQDYGTSSRLAEVQAIAEARISPPRLSQPLTPLSLIDSYTVITPKILSKAWGLAGPEIKLASEAGHFLDSLGLPLWYAVISDRAKSESEIRQLFREFKNCLVQAQDRAGIPKYWLEMLESRPSVHANILFPLADSRAGKLVQDWQGSESFPGDTLNVQATYGKGSEWFVGYCSKERISQAKWLGGINMAARIKGAHPLGEGGGDRVRLSKQLEADMHAAGCRIEPRRRVYASRALQKLSPLLLPAKPVCNLVQSEFQLVLLDDYRRPVARQIARLHDYVGGLLPPSVAMEVEHLRRRLGLTQSELAQRAGISQPQLANVVAGRFGLAAWTAARLRDVLLAEAA